MVVYLAGPWARRSEVRTAREILQRAGITVNSRWLDFDSDANDEHNADVQRREAETDIQDIQAADILVVLNLEKSEGKAFEQGVAFMLGTPVVVVGAISTVFQQMAGFTQVDSLFDAIEHLKNDPSYSPY